MKPAIEQLCAEGFKVFPIAPGAKFPPLIPGWPQKATSDLAAARDLFMVAPEGANIGIHCAGLLVLDIDTKKGGDDTLRFIRDTFDLPATRSARTGSGGEHLYFRLPHDHQGVANSVERLGRGIDVRSAGGYVVAPGSATPAGAYAWVDATVPIAEAPEWLVQRCGVVQERAATEAHNTADAPDEVVERAAEWLRTAERSIKGQGGDQAAYRVACRLRDFGVSYNQACELMRSDAWDLGCGWREGRLEAKPIRSAYKYATGEPGSKAALPDDFPVVEVSLKPTELGTNRTAVMRLSAFAEQAATGAGYTIKGLFQRRSYAEVYGAPGEGKTFVMLDMAYHVAAGQPWMEHKVHEGPVLYLAFEGRGGLVSRAKALRQHYGTADVPLYVAGAAFSIREPQGRKALGELMAQLPAKPVMIVFDTFAKALMGGDENSAQDVGAFNNAIEALIENTGACIVIVHHSGKDKSKGARGSSALLGALDTEIEIDEGQVIARKQRDIEMAEPIGFKLVPVLVGLDADGDDITSCVVEPSVAQSGPVNERISGNAKRALGVLCEIAPNNAPVDAGAWRAKCAEFLGARSLAQRFYDVKKQLAAKGYILVDAQNNVTRRMT